MQIDLYRLHKFFLIEDYYVIAPRRSGKTFASICVLIGEIQLGDSEIIVVTCDSNNIVSNFLDMAKELFEHMGIKILRINSDPRKKDLEVVYEGRRKRLRLIGGWDVDGVRATVVDIK